MSTLKTNNIEHLDASSPSIQTTIGGGVIFAGLSTFVGNAEFDGNVNIAGTITYDDVTNIDSVGIITARSGIEFGASGVGGTITSAGAATFAQQVTTAGDPYNGGFTGGKLGTGAIQMSNSSSNALWTGHTTGSATVTSKILASGAATFTGKITTTNTVKCRDVNSAYGGFYFTSTAILPTQVDGNYATTGLSLGASSGRFNHLYLTGDVTAGAATFAGIVTATSFSGDGSALTGVESWNQQDTWLYGGG